MMLSLTPKGEPDGHHQAQIEIRKDSKARPDCKQANEELDFRSIEAPCFDKGVGVENQSIEAGRYGVEAGDSAGDASPAQGRHHSRHHEGDRLAAALSARLLCGRRQEEAQAESCFREGRRYQDVPDRKGEHRVMIPAQQGPLAQPADPAVEAELDRLPTTPIAELRLRYGELFRAEPPKAFGPDLLRRSIAQRIQEKAYGGLSRETQRLLDQLVKAAIAKPNGRLELPRRIKPGSELVRTWNKKTHRVMVMADGFAYDGKTFASLSEIASEITGTRWNGPRFFGLRSTSSKDAAYGE
jgi:hypothetical protein